jgi:hypothetical protein
MGEPIAFDDAVVGAGILGLAHAYHLARRGRRVVVFERDSRALGASVRNFGMLWPIGQPAGPMRRMAMRSREVWLDILGASGIWHERTGSLHLAYRDDEAQVLAEFADRARGTGFECELLDPSQTRKRAPLVRLDDLRVGLSVLGKRASSRARRSPVSLRGSNAHEACSSRLGPRFWDSIDPRCEPPKVTGQPTAFGSARAMISAPFTPTHSGSTPSRGANCR